MDRPRVLVVEDSPSVLRLMATVLETGHDVTTASGGSAALSLIGSIPLEVVLTDVRMAGATGFDVLRAVQDRAPRTAVVMITAYATVADAVAAMRLGAYDYVAKPIVASEISLVVARAVEHVRREEPTDSLARVAPPDRCDDLAMGFHRAAELARQRASRDYLVRLMQLFQGNVTQAATRAGMTRESLHRVLRQYDVQSEDYKQPLAQVIPARQAAR